MQAEKTEVIRTGITGSTLKIIAMITMLIDHIGATIVLQLVQRNSDNFDAFGNVRMTGMVILYYVLRGIGRLAICAAYGFRNQKKELQMAVPCIVLSVLNMSELCALADAGIVHFYNGKRGLKLKWVFYIFYPLHLLILAGICVLLFK